MKCMVFLLSVILAAGSVRADSAADLAAIRTQLLAHSANTINPDAWRQVMADLDGVILRAGESGDGSLTVEASLLKAMALSDMRGEHEQATRVLRGLIGRYGSQRMPGFQAVYVRLAETHAKTGDSQAILTLIEEFRNSPNYDGQKYDYSGGRSPSDPIRIVRPHGPNGGSSTVTAMERALLQAKSAPGRRCPDFRAVDLSGVPVSSRDMDGFLVLIDFWSFRFPRWEQSLPELVRIQKRYENAGFKVIGVPVESNFTESLNALRQAGALWPQLRPDPELMKAFGVFGEIANVLVDPSGRIIGSNLYGIELEAAIRDAIEIQ